MIGIYCRTSKDIGNLSIDQQKNLGVKFALINNLDYRIYIDEGISGFKINDDDEDLRKLFTNRPSFARLVNDIEKKEIDKIWVFERSRLSRNELASAYIFRIFEKYNIELYENNKLINFKDPHSKFTRQIMDAVSELERSQIVARTTRGLYDAINRGSRGQPKLFGYKNFGKITEGKKLKAIWKPVENEINDMKYIYDEFLKGKSLRSISFNLFHISGKKQINQLLRYATKISRFMKHCEYTGYALNMDGLAILHRYDKLEIDNISVLANKEKYWVKSIPYPVEIITIENWIKVIEKLHANKIIRKEGLNKSRKAEKDLATGIVSCSVCGIRFFAYQTLYKRPNGDKYYYHYYKHHQAINGTICSHKPKTIDVKKVDEIFKSFFFFYYIVFNEANVFVKDTMEKLRYDIRTIENKINSDERNRIKINKQIENLDDKLAFIEDNEVYELTAKKIISLRAEIQEKIDLISNLKIELEKLRNKLSQTELENTYINIKEKVISFFTEMDIEDKRNELLRIIKKCSLFGQHILIDTGNLLFLFDINLGITFDEKLLNNLNKDKIYKDYFINNSQKKPRKYDIPAPDKISYMNDGDNLFIDLDLSNEQDNYEAIEYLKSSGIDYEISEHEKFIISF
jgi:DNA invertase Pin-like site-specific DNA recombinase/regulator of replication initiation timing